jgi:S1-C subfamily serine protease
MTFDNITVVPAAASGELALAVVENPPPSLSESGDGAANVDDKQAADSEQLNPPSDEVPRRGNQLVTAVIWLAATFSFLAMLRYFLPGVVEEIQFASARGKQRAEYEVATAGLKSAPLGDLSKAWQMVSQRASPSVVHIRIENPDVESESEFHRLFGPGIPESLGQGSGVIVDEQGYILTNYHVVRGSGEITVRLGDGREARARKVGDDSLTDLTVLKIDADKLVAAEWGDSSQVQVGALVWAVGSPFGLERSVTFGILSAKHRGGLAGASYQDFLQTDAAVNPGNSGGPLVDSQGRVIGINTAIVGQTYQGVSFAIPSEIARDVYDRIKTEGRVARGYLGVYLAEVTARDANRLKMRQPKGALVAALKDDGESSPAKTAGLQAQDVILKWNGRSVETSAAFSRMVAASGVGETAVLTVWRDGKEFFFEITVAERPLD